MKKFRDFQIIAKELIKNHNGKPIEDVLKDNPYEIKNWLSNLTLPILLLNTKKVLPKEIKECYDELSLYWKSSKLNGRPCNEEDIHMGRIFLEKIIQYKPTS